MLEIRQGIIHPSHVPLEGEAQCLLARRSFTCDARPRGGFLGNGRHTGKFTVHHMIRITQQFNGLQVLVASVNVWCPLAFLARVIEVQHGRHRIHAQTVHVKHVTPETGVGSDEIFHFRPAKVEHRCSPIRMLAPFRIGMFEKGRAIKACQGPVVLWKMRRHPVNHHPNIGLMQGVDEKLKILRRTIATARRIKTGDLITPGGIVGVFRNRQKLHMCEAHLANVINQPPG